jgi:hypothetical protein
MFAKGGIATAAVGAMALASATPSQARDRDKVDAGDVIAGALIIGGIAAIASAASKDRYRDDHRYGDGYSYRDNRYGHGNSRAAVERCVRAVERDARRAGFRYAQVTEIRDVDRERRGWEVTGRLVVDDGYHRGYRGDRSRVRYDDRRDRYRDRDLDRGRFKCEIRRGKIVDIDYKGIRGLR